MGKLYGCIRSHVFPREIADGGGGDASPAARYEGALRASAVPALVVLFVPRDSSDELPHGTIFEPADFSNASYKKTTRPKTAIFSIDTL